MRMPVLPYARPRHQSTQEAVGLFVRGFCVGYVGFLGVLWIPKLAGWDVPQGRSVTTALFFFAVIAAIIVFAVTECFRRRRPFIFGLLVMPFLLSLLLGWLALFPDA